MDLIPGDYYSATIVNDTPALVRVVTCADDPCTKLDEANGVTVPPRGRQSLLTNARGDRFLAFDPRTGTRLGCLTPPSSATGDVRGSPRVRVGAATPCDVPPVYPDHPAWLIPVSGVSALAFIAAAVLAILGWRATRDKPPDGRLVTPV
jgi:hypothetical protein